MTKTDQKAAFLNWYQPIHQRFVRYCSSRVFGIMDTEDLVQEAILASLTQWSKLENKDKLLSYLMGTVNNLVRNHRRRLKFQGALDEQRLAQLKSRLGDAETALDVHYLLKALEQLPKSQGEALHLFEISGFSIKEIAKIQSTSEGAIKTKLSRSRKKLRELLSEEHATITLSQRLQIYTSILL